MPDAIQLRAFGAPGDLGWVIRTPRAAVRPRARLEHGLRDPRRTDRRRVRRGPRPAARARLDRRARRAPRRLRVLRPGRRRDGEAAPPAGRARRPRARRGAPARRRVPGLRARCRLPADGALDERRPGLGAPDLRGRGVRARAEERHRSFGHDLVGPDLQRRCSSGYPPTTTSLRSPRANTASARAPSITSQKHCSAISARSTCPDSWRAGA